ncbi:hypothetical protein D3C72_1410500 [compost metagenome]
MTGELRITREACSGDSWKMLRSAPRQISRDMTIASRSGSIGGLVTWANCWRKKSYGERTRCDSTAIGVSSPIEPTASWPCSPSGRSTWSRSSKVTWNIFMYCLSWSAS